MDRSAKFSAHRRANAPLLSMDEQKVFSTHRRAHGLFYGERANGIFFGEKSKCSLLY